MHRGVILATLMCGLVILAAGVYFVIDLMSVRSSIMTLRNASGMRVVCAAASVPGYQPGNDPVEAVSICRMSCEERGFKASDPGNSLVIDYASEEGFRRAQYKWRNTIPAACKGNLRFRTGSLP
jgi:hypothetical protein